MPKVALREAFDMQTRDKYTKVECEIGITVNGRELPSAAVLGSALEEIIKIVEARVKESYEVVPPRAVEPVPVVAAVPQQPVETVTLTEVKPVGIAPAGGIQAPVVPTQRPT